VCLNWGCIPTKALLKSGEQYETLTSHLKDYGLSAQQPAFDFQAVVQRSRGIAKQLNSGVGFLMKKHKVEVIEGVGRFEKGEGAPVVVVKLNKDGSERRVQAKSVILATGARARTIPAIGMAPDGERIWTYREAMTPTFMPKSLVVIGSGAIGIEFASFYRALGAEVMVVEALDRILSAEDVEVSKAAHKAFEKRGMKFRVPAKVNKLARDGDDVVLDIDVGGKPEQLRAEAAIVAVGTVANVEDIGLDELGLEVDRGRVVTGPHGETNVPGLYAIGDVAGGPWLAHKASHEGIHTVEHIAGAPGMGPIKAPIPGCTYSQPQIASVGLTEEQAKTAGLKLKVGRFPFKVNGKAIASGETEGFVKTIFDESTGALLGAHMIGAEVTEMIQGFALAITLEATEAELHAAVFPHPTMSEAMHEASLDAYGRVLHI
jgi:dihydrolipoamide dehydrogenase